MPAKQSHSDAYYRRRIMAAFPALKIENVERHDEGMINTVLIVNRQRVFRFTEGDWPRQSLRQETRALALARRHIEMRLPYFDHVAEDMVSYAYIPGEPLLWDNILRADQETQAALAAELATFLRQLHAIPVAEAEEQGIGPSDTVRAAGDWLRLHQQVERELMPHFTPDIMEWCRRLFAPVLADSAFMDYQPCFMNGDVGPYHVLYDRSAQRLSGIIDFGTVGLGDPAADFACIINNYGESFLRRMGAAYPAIADHIERARFWAGTLELQWLLRGLPHRDMFWLTAHLGRARDVMPLTSGWPPTQSPLSSL